MRPALSPQTVRAIYQGPAAIAMTRLARAGDVLVAGGVEGTAAAFLLQAKGYMGVTAAHIFRLARTDALRIGGLDCKVSRRRLEFDLAYFPISQADVTELNSPEYGEAAILSRWGKRRCRISDLGWSICIVVLEPKDLPISGESGAPIVQDGCVVAMLSSINLNTCKGTAISADLIRME